MCSIFTWPISGYQSTFSFQMENIERVYINMSIPFLIVFLKYPLNLFEHVNIM